MSGAQISTLFGRLLALHGEVECLRQGVRYAGVRYSAALPGRPASYAACTVRHRQIVELPLSAAAVAALHEAEAILAAAQKDVE